MIFESLVESAEKGELILLNGGFCRWHLRRDRQLTIREILVLPESQRQGIGKKMLEILKTKDADFIFARCPADLPSNQWYEHMNFTLCGTITTRSGRKVNEWRLRL